MPRSQGAGPGFGGKATPVASLRLTHAVAASLVIALSVCLMATLVLSLNTHLPLPA
jgi:hypothetical protein